MVGIKKEAFSKILLILLIILNSCKTNDKETKRIESEITKDEKINKELCFVKNNTSTKINDNHVKFEGFEVQTVSNVKNFDIVINKKLFYANIELDLGTVKYHLYNCENEKILMIELDDYYSSIYYVFYYNNLDLYLLGTMNINQPNVEKEGVFSKDFIISKSENQFNIESTLDRKVYETKTFILKQKIETSDKSYSDNSSSVTSIFNRWVDDKDISEINITDKVVYYVFSGQCLYSFPVKKINDKEVELIWGQTARDCVYEVFFEETFDLPKDKIPQIGKPFSKYNVDNGVLKVTYYYKEWVNKYKKKMIEVEKPFPFEESFRLKKEEE